MTCHFYKSGQLIKWHNFCRYIYQSFNGFCGELSNYKLASIFLCGMVDDSNHKYGTQKQIT